MADLWAFKSKDVAEELRRMAEDSMGIAGNSNPMGTEVILAKVANSGDPVEARSGDTVSGPYTASVVRFGEGETDLAATAAAEDVTFWNLSEQSYTDDNYIQLVKWRTYWIIPPAAAGGGSSGSQNFVIVANSGISAATWATAGTGTGDIWELATGGASWSAIGGASVDIRNPWEETIASGSRMVCYKDGDYYVVIQASCPSV